MPPLASPEAHEFLARNRRGILLTLRRDGRPQSSNVTYEAADGVVRVSVTETRAKTANARRDPRVSLHVSSEDFWTYVVAEGRARLSAVAQEPGDDTCLRLLALYERLAGPHPDPEEFHQAMVDQRRLELSFEIERLYPLA